MENLPPPLRILQLILAGFCLFLGALLLFIIFFSPMITSAPRVVLEDTSPAALPVDVSRSFRFQNDSVPVTLAVNSSVYAASKKTYRSTFLLGDPNDLGTRYYQAMINDPSQDRIYRDLIDQFRQIRSERNLTDDEYLELISVYVQSIPYRDGGETPPKYPAELLVEGMGDCDDKSILIAGLLAREGYSVVLFKFGPESHMAMGIGSDAFPYKSTGYTYLEGMSLAYAGFPTAHLRIPLNSDPQIIMVSNGTKLYHSGNETRYINDMSSLAEQKADVLTQMLEGFPQSDSTSTKYRAILRERDRFSAIHMYIRSHPYDRPGVYAYLQREMAGMNDSTSSTMVF
ncbi:MAG: hypothetical protein WC379_12345 [Methanoregula sp.]|jgi:hypothetical protein